MARKSNKRLTTSQKSGNNPPKNDGSSAVSGGKIPTGGEKVVQCLEREGVDVVFGLPGGLREGVCSLLAAQRFREHRQREDVQVPGQFFHDP